MTKEFEQMVIDRAHRSATTYRVTSDAPYRFSDVGLFDFSHRIKEAVEGPLLALIEQRQEEGLTQFAKFQELQAENTRLREESFNWAQKYGDALEELAALKLKHEVACDTITRMQHEREMLHATLKKREAESAASGVEDANAFNLHHEEMLRLLEVATAQRGEWK